MFKKVRDLCLSETIVSGDGIKSWSFIFFREALTEATSQPLDCSVWRGVASPLHHCALCHFCPRRKSVHAQMKQPRLKPPGASVCWACQGPSSFPWGGGPLLSLCAVWSEPSLIKLIRNHPLCDLSQVWAPVSRASATGNCDIALR